MTVQADFRLNLVAAISAELPTVQVLPGPPAENEDARESVFIDGLSSTFEWRSLGTGTQLLKNRTEDVTATVRARVYREAPDQLSALADADARMDEIVAAIELAVAQDPSIAGAISMARVESADRTVAPGASGWTVSCTLRVTGTNYP